MKIIICTTPIRPTPTSYPPFACMALMQSLRSAGYSPYFYDIDGLRPTFKEVVDFFRDQAPDMVGVSAVVSTAYAYTKNLVRAIKEVSPKTKVVVGGNLAASSELLLRFCGVDVCAIGEGERVIVKLAKSWEEHRGQKDYSHLHEIKGLSYLDEHGEMAFTGYDVPIPAAEFLDPDWTILEKYSRIGNFITNPLERYDTAQDPRSYDSHRRGKKRAIVVTAKGCVARCTFCHRWDKGYRHWPVDRIMSKIEYLMDRYNVGFISFGDENFGSDRRKLDELIERIRPLNILYNIGGVRCRTVDQDLLRRLKESGCVSMYYGMETGSPDILSVMEKNSSLQDNINAARWTYEAGIYTTYQFVLGMPGETHKTIAETSDFVNKITEFLPEPPERRLSMNYIQTLPGTPVYEYARTNGLIGKTFEDEEKYLISISDINANDDTKMLNFTEYDYLTVQSWRATIVDNARRNWYRKRNWAPVPKTPGELLRKQSINPDTEAALDDYDTGGYFNFPKLYVGRHRIYRAMESPIGRPLRFLVPAYYLLRRNWRASKRQTIVHLSEYTWNKLDLTKRRRRLTDVRSLRQVMKDTAPIPVTPSEKSMKPLREGR